MKRDRSYHDLSPGEKQRYDRLMGLVRRLGNDPGSRRAKRCGSRYKRRQRLRDAAQAMLGLRREEDTRTTADYEPGKREPGKRPWIGSTTSWAPRGKASS